MKKFKCTVTRVDEYEIEINDDVIDENWMKNFRKYMYNFADHEDHAEHLAQLRARFGEEFYEGYGYVSVNGKKPFSVKGNKENEQHYEPAINIIVVSEDNDCDVDIDEL